MSARLLILLQTRSIGAVVLEQQRLGGEIEPEVPRVVGEEAEQEAQNDQDPDGSSQQEVAVGRRQVSHRQILPQALCAVRRGTITAKDVSHGRPR